MYLKRLDTNDVQQVQIVMAVVWKMANMSHNTLDHNQVQAWAGVPVAAAANKR